MDEETLIKEKEKKPEEIKKEAEKRSCPVQRLLYYINEFINGPMCGKCFPCSLGTQEAKIKLLRIVYNLTNVSLSDINALKRIGAQMTEGSFCKKGKDTGRYISDILITSEWEFIQHISGNCPNKECINSIEYIINSDLCSLCGKCLQACKYDAITYKEESHEFFPIEINQDKCTRCGECIKVCPTEAIDLITIEREELSSKK